MISTCCMTWRYKFKPGHDDALSMAVGMPGLGGEKLKLGWISAMGFGEAHG